MDLEFRQSELFEPCLRKWALAYRRQLVRKRERPSKAGIGTLAHKGLERIYLGEIDWELTVRQLWEAGAATIEDKPEYVKEYRKQLDLTLVMVSGYESWLAETGADVGWEIVSVERRLRAPWRAYEVPGIGTVNVTITGQADLEILDEYGLPRLVDHKTRDSVAPSAMDSMDQQRLTYGVLRMLEDGTLYAGAIHNILRRVGRTAAAKPPFYGRNEQTFTIDQLRKHYQHMDARIARLVPLAARIECKVLGLDSPELFPSPDSTCSWRCQFKDVCPMFDDGSDWAWSLNELFKPSETLEINSGEES